MILFVQNEVLNLYERASVTNRAKKNHGNVRVFPSSTRAAVLLKNTWAQGDSCSLRETLPAAPQEGTASDPSAGRRRGEQAALLTQLFSPQLRLVLLGTKTGLREILL